MTENQINEICKAFVYGRTAEDIAEIEGMTVSEVKKLLSDNAEKVQELKKFYKAMEVI